MLSLTIVLNINRIYVLLMDQKDFEQMIEKIESSFLKMEKADRQYRMALQDLKDMIKDWRQKNVNDISQH
jgi:hypothetical protein